MPDDSVVDSVPGFRPGKNGGKLLAGGKPGNKGGLGKPPNEIREMMRDGLAKGVEQIVQDLDILDPATKIRAIDVLGKFSIGTQANVQVQHEASQEVADALRAMVARWYDELDRDLADRLADDVDRALESIVQVQ